MDEPRRLTQHADLGMFIGAVLCGVGRCLFALYRDREHLEDVASGVWIAFVPTAVGCISGIFAGRRPTILRGMIRGGLLSGGGIGVLLYLLMIPWAIGCDWLYGPVSILHMSEFGTPWQSDFSTWSILVIHALIGILAGGIGVYLNQRFNQTPSPEEAGTDVASS
jgi:hypothetical protein